LAIRTVHWANQTSTISDQSTTYSSTGTFDDPDMIPFTLYSSSGTESIDIKQVIPQVLVYFPSRFGLRFQAYN